MRILCYYQESIIPDKLEDVVEGTEYLDGLILFYAIQKSKNIKGIEKVAGIKEEDVSLVIEPIVEGVPIRFKGRDRVIVYNIEYRILQVTEEIPMKFRLRASRNKALYERYVKRTLYLGV